jgi:hypothetical protein
VGHPPKHECVTAEILARHHPPGYRRCQFFAAEAAPIGLAVPPERVHTERFDMV